MTLSMRFAAVALALLAAPRPTPAQVPLRPLSALGGDADERLRVAQLLGRAPTDGALLRSASVALTDSGGATRWALVAPAFVLVRNSRLPYSLNDGALWAGRGTSVLLAGGVVARRGALRVQIIPELVHQANGFVAPPDTPYAPPLPAGRRPFGNPWHVRPESIDLPLRPGADAVTAILPGQSSITVTHRALEMGASTANRWWGPGVQSALVLSNNAAGFPHLFVTTARPVVTRAGVFEAQWLLGGLAESAHFDSLPDNDLRGMNALAVTWRARPDAGLTLGLARAVLRPVDNTAGILRGALDVALTWPRPNDRPAADSAPRPGPDQITSLFARWVLPESGFEAYVEWGRAELPQSLRDLILLPGHSQAYVAGFQWARPVRATDVLRFSGEASYLARDATFRNRPTYSWYTSRAVPQGYTQRGQVLGAAIGPGSSAQSLALDWLAPAWRAGIFAGRIRWDDDALFRSPRPNAIDNVRCSHDLSLLAGVRGGWNSRWGHVMASAATSRRYNLYFQNAVDCTTVQTNKGRIDYNGTFTLTIVPGR